MAAGPFDLVRRFWIGVAGSILGGGIVVAAVAMLLGGQLFGYERLVQATRTEVASEKPPPAVVQTETLFLSGVKNSPSMGDEWWAARSDHRLVAFAVLNCKKVPGISPDTLPPRYFTRLLLDLAPSGNHVFSAKEGEEAVVAARDRGIAPLDLTSTEQDLLSLSDSVARARMAAAQGASTNVPWVQRLGLLTLAVAALATLFVTLQGKMRPVDLKDEEKEALDRAPLPSRIRHTLAGPGAGFRWVAFCAISLSILGTSLTGLKQVYDPTRTLTQNTRALLDLRQLHQEIILGVRCDEGNKIALAPEPKPDWTGAIKRIRATIIPEYGAYANLDVGGSSQRPDPTQPVSHQQPVVGPNASKAPIDQGTAPSRVSTGPTARRDQPAGQSRP